MKRKGSKKVEKTDDENGVEETQENGGSHEPQKKKAKKSKNKNSKSKHDSREVVSTDENEEDDQSTDGRDPLAGDEEDAEYEVEAIMDDKLVKGVQHFLIRWKGYTEESDTWEPEHTLECDELIKEYKEKSKKDKKAVKKKGNKGKKEKSSEKFDENEDFEVDKIVDVYFHKNGKRDFLVSWKGYPSSENSWEPEDNMDCKDLIKKFMEKVEKARQFEGKESKLRINRKPVERLEFSMYENSRRLSKRRRGKERVHYFDAE